MINRTQISAVMAAVNVEGLSSVNARNAARLDAVESFLDAENTVAVWVDGSEKDMIMSDLESYPEWEK